MAYHFYHLPHCSKQGGHALVGEKALLQVDLANTTKAQAFCCISKANLKGEPFPIECMTALLRTMG